MTNQNDVRSIMKYSLTLLLLVFSQISFAATQNNISELNKELIPIYNSILLDKSTVSNICTMKLKLHFASSDYLLFQDGKIKTSKGESYHFLKFKKGMSIPKGLTPNDIVEVTFKIETIVKGEISPGMPHIIVSLVSIRPNN